MGGKGLSFYHFVRVEAIFPLRNGGHWPHGVNRRHLGGLIVRLQKDTLRRQCHSLGHFFDGFCRLGGGGGGCSLFLQRKGEGGESGGGHGFGFHCIE